MNFYPLIISFVLSIVVCNGQTVGHFSNSQEAYNGYTLFSPATHTTTHLIDNCGYEVNRWTSNFLPGMASYLLDNGSLLRACKVNSPVFAGGGIGGRLEIKNWDDNLLWSYNIADSSHHQHHDIEPLPNGNILLIAWESKTRAQAIAAGRDSATFESALWPEKVIELKPIFPDSATVVWKWNLWDHLIQDHDPSQANYGVVSQHPELIDINYSTSDPKFSEDWIHMNSVDYNEELDQILLSSRNFNEIWIIDHSTTTAEAATHSGGNSGMGGDILYRYGNPIAYKRGALGDQVFFSQHDPQWIPKGYPDEDKIIIYNNGQGRPGGDASSVDIIVPPLNSSNNYDIAANQPYDPMDLDWSYPPVKSINFYSQIVSGADRLPNGNTLICEGNKGHFFEIDQTGNVVWEYINPVILGGPVSQGNLANNNPVFKIERYPSDYSAFDGRDLSPSAPVELNPVPYNCEIFDSTSTNIYDISANEVKIYPLPAQEKVHIKNTSLIVDASMYDLSGKLLYKNAARSLKLTIPLQFNSGIYLLKIETEKETSLHKIIIK
ncbi:MAG: T9SS type A sorting domain-containing protein [Chitinophagales bacterium]|nr:T9SS type A sorting domain-containing protein [Chitinophagales bacterium]